MIDNIFQDMNEVISEPEIDYIKRRIGAKIREAVKNFPVIVVSGARQVGKSTLLKNEFCDFFYYTMDDFATLEMAQIDPPSLWKDKDRIIIDEAQKLPAIFTAIKLTVDSDKSKRFIISGSSNLLLMEKITESLAGRALYFDLLPMTYGEIGGILSLSNFLSLWEGDKINTSQSIDTIDPLPFLMRGFMPPTLTLKKHTDVLLWLEGYTKTYLERDLRELSQVESLIDFRKVMQILALRTGNVLNQAEVAKDSKVSHPTTHRYIKLLEVSNIVQRVGPFFSNRTKRIIKSPKLYFIDPALSIFLAGYFDKESLVKARELGSFFETMVYLHLRSICETMTPRAQLHYWRLTTGKEIDFVIEYGKKLLALEVKMTDNPTIRDIHTILAFLQDYPETILGILVTSSNVIKWLHSKVITVPWWWLDI
jgi:predicted AAA+ superfamily ATPase